MRKAVTLLEARQRSIGPQVYILYDIFHVIEGYMLFHRSHDEMLISLHQVFERIHVPAEDPTYNFLITGLSRVIFHVPPIV